MLLWSRHTTILEVVTGSPTTAPIDGSYEGKDIEGGNDERAWGREVGTM